MKNIDYRDLIAGALLSGFGVTVAVTATHNYEIGTPSAMGPGFFPMLVGWILAGVGGLIIVFALINTKHLVKPPPLALRSLLSILAGIAAFSLLIERLGLVPATLALIFIVMLADRPYRLKRAAILAAVLACMSWLIFIQGLDMQVQPFAFNF